jgi:peptidyl-prolyl cis-trans isomerase A (cyclophilin A)
MFAMSFRLTLAALLVIGVGAAQEPPPQSAPLEPGLYAVFTTAMGSFTARLFEDKAPNAVKNFVALAKGEKAAADKTSAMVKKPYYNGLTFHRVIKGFMIQTGDVKAAGNTVCGVPNFKDEISPDLKFDVVGRLAMANTGRPNTNSCQIFITVGRSADLDGKYTIFGQVVDGQDVVNNLSKVPTGANDKPVIPQILKTVVIERKP